MPNDGDEFAAFVRANSRPPWQAAWLLRGNWSTAEALAQTGLTAAWRHWDDIRRTDAPQIEVHRAMLDAYRRDRRRWWVGEVPTERIGEAARRLGASVPRCLGASVPR
jgi:hypothetical protein